jgi:DNA-binding transcriptional ArsR family regulator
MAVEGRNAAATAFISTFDGLRMSNDTYLPMPNAGELEFSRVLEALADPVRLQIVAALASGERPCGSFPLPVGDSTRSHHLRILREAGVTRTRVSGTQRLVSLRRDELERRFPGLLDSVLAASAAA